MNDILEIKESLIKHLHREKSRSGLNFDECFSCAYRPDGQDTCESLNALITDTYKLIKRLEPHILGLNEIQEGYGYWLCVPGDFVSRPVICVHKEMDAQKPYITFAWQFGTFSWDTEEYGMGWCCWSAKPTIC